MAGKDFYLITSLPSLGPLGSKPPVDAHQLLEHVQPSRAGAELVRAILLSDDLLQRQSYLAGEIQQVAPVVLTPAQVRDQEPLPAYLASQAEQGRPLIDSLWAAYYRYADQVAQRCGSEFLAKWVGFEVAFRNALVIARAKALGLDAEAYLVEPDLAARGLDFGPALAEWASAPHPLAGLRVLDSARWDWLARNDAYYSFGHDELAAYAAKLMLLHRWHRLSEAAALPAGQTPGQPSERTLP